MQEMQKVINYKSGGYMWKILSILFVLLLAYIAYAVFVPKKERSAYKYISKPLKKGDLTIKVSANGNIQPTQQVDVGCEVSGTITNVFVDYNDEVKKGQLLAQIDKTKYESNLKRVKASLAVAQASLENMEAQLHKAELRVNSNKLLKENTNGRLPSKNDWDNDYAAFLVAKAQVKSAKAQINQVKQDLISTEYDLQRTNIYSPVDGIVLVRNIDSGQTVAASFQTPVLFKLAKDLKHMELQASIDEADIAKVKKDQLVEFNVDAYPNMTFNTKINKVRVNSEIVNGVVTYLAIMDFDNKELLLKPGMSADIDITTKKIQNTFIIPKAALLYMPVEPKTKTLFGSRDHKKLAIDPKPHIWVLKENKPKKVYVKVLGNSGSQSAIETDELKEGDGVIISQETNQ